MFWDVWASIGHQQVCSDNRLRPCLFWPLGDGNASRYVQRSRQSRGARSTRRRDVRPPRRPCCKAPRVVALRCLEEKPEWNQSDSRSALAAAWMRSLTSASSRAARSMRSCCESARSCALSARERTTSSSAASLSTDRVRSANWLATISVSSRPTLSPLTGTLGITKSPGARAAAAHRYYHTCRGFSSRACPRADPIGGAGEESSPGNSSSVVLCHSRNAAGGETIAHVAEAAGPAPPDFYPEAPQIQEPFGVEMFVPPRLASTG